MPCALGKQRQEYQLRPSVAFAKRMNGVQFRQDVRGATGELERHQSFQVVGFLKSIEQLRQLKRDMFGIAEHAAILRNPDGANLARPCIYVLKQVEMNRSIVRDVEIACRQLFGGALAGNFGFERFQPVLFAKIELVDENGCIRITVRI